ncbi:hypothetical protein EUGRSUZ_E04273 [Eucalyptus grandis]|uniref:Uncharacterized protein n=2 Tax=Eucalyptus grandis TaxID=71139 RepID=A0ACC3L1Q0_EUCGR|nr:hypothetical protein EUGRSUZ_E04273 [Eucalyptus grandis]
MSQSTIRKMLGAVKDQTSIGLAKVAGNMAQEAKVNIVKATSDDDDPVDEKYIRRTLNLASLSRGYVLAFTHDYVVALKSLVVIRRLVNDGDPIFRKEITYATWHGARLLNLSDFRDEAQSSSWDHSAFARTYAMYLDKQLELILFDRKSGGGGPSGSANGGGEYGNFGGMRRSRSYGDMSDGVAVKEGKEDRRVVTALREMKQERIFGKMGHLQRLLDQFLVCRSTCLAKNSSLILVALYTVVKERFQVYADICEVLAVLLDKFFNMEYQDCIKAFDAYASAVKQIDELIAFYNWCKDTGLARLSEYPEVQRITSKYLETLEEFVRDRAKRPKSPERREELPPLINLHWLYLRGHTGNDSWEAFPSNGEPEVTSAWQTPAAESGKEDWELALVETASNLSKQKGALGGGFDPLLLNGMYD